KEILVLIRVEERRLRVCDRERQRQKECFQETGPAERIGGHRCLSENEGERWLSYGSQRGRVGRVTNMENEVTSCPRDASFSIPRLGFLLAHRSCSRRSACRSSTRICIASPARRAPHSPITRTAPISQPRWPRPSTCSIA